MWGGRKVKLRGWRKLENLTECKWPADCSQLGGRKYKWQSKSDLSATLAALYQHHLPSQSTNSSILLKVRAPGSPLEQGLAGKPTGAVHPPQDCAHQPTGARRRPFARPLMHLGRSGVLNSATAGCVEVVCEHRTYYIARSSSVAIACPALPSRINVGNAGENSAVGRLGLGLGCLVPLAGGGRSP